jgi:hypothetical protein
MEEQTANDILAYCVVFCNTPVPYEVAREMTFSDPLFIALKKAVKTKMKIEEERFCRICAVIHNANYQNKLNPSDFMAKEPKSQEDIDREIMTNLDRFAVLQEKGLIRN